MPRCVVIISLIIIFLRCFTDYGNTLFICLKYTSLTLFLVYVGVPIFVRANQWILPKVVFSNILRWPPFTNLSQPKDFGLSHARSFNLHVEDGVDIGAWHILPRSVVDESKDLSLYDFENELNDGKMVFLYLHGNTGTRGSHHRVQLYKLLASLDFHVVVIDYRGYGDSTGSPTENGVVKDAYFTYKWLKQRIGGSRLFIWGHSLGTGVTTKLAKKLCDEGKIASVDQLDLEIVQRVFHNFMKMYSIARIAGDHPDGIVLESPFNNIQEAAVNHPFAKPYRMLPWFKWIFVDGLGEQGIFFSSDENILSVTPHIMILHAEDDLVVPFHLGKRLYQSAKQSRPEHLGDVEFVEFEGHHGFGHKLIYQAPELPNLIRNFVAKAKRK